MARITARFNGKCSKCNGTLPKGSEIEYREKRAFHVECATNSEDENQQPGPDAHQLADALGFRQYTWEELTPSRSE